MEERRGQALEDGGLRCVLDGGHRPRDAESRQTVEAGHGVLLMRGVFGFLWSVLR